MWSRKINVEKDFLVIFRKAGSYSNFRWFSADKFNEKCMQENIEKYNTNPYRKTDGLVGEVMTDKLVREICAYKEHGKQFEDLIREAEEVQQCINQAKEYLKTAMENIDGIMGLE